jgi:hypothetical protein
MAPEGGSIAQRAIDGIAITPNSAIAGEVGMKRWPDYWIHIEIFDVKSPSTRRGVPRGNNIFRSVLAFRTGYSSVSRRRTIS